MTKRSGASWLLVLLLGAGSGAAAEEGRTGAQQPPVAAATPADAAAEAPPGAVKLHDATEGDPTWYAQALAQGPGGLNVTQFWSKGPKLRAETVIAGRKIVTLVDGEWYYAYDATKGLGIRVRRAPEATAKDAPYHRPFGNDAVNLIRQGAEKIREENFHGREVEIYQITDAHGRRTVWATKDALNIPLRVEMYNRRSGALQSTDYVDWLTGLALSDRYFERDPNVEIETYELDEWASYSGKLGGMGPVPVLYMDLLRGR